MWGRFADVATRSAAPLPLFGMSEMPRSGALPRPQVPNSPPALVESAGFALQPCFVALEHVAHHAIAAWNAILRRSRGKRRDGAPRPGPRIFPRHAHVPAAASERLGC